MRQQQKSGPRSSTKKKMTMTLKDYIEYKVKGVPVMIFTKIACPYCVKVKKLLQRLDAPYSIEEIDKRTNTAQFQDTLLKMTGVRSVPSVFFLGEHMGGFDDLNKYHKDGLLEGMLRRVYEDFYINKRLIDWAEY